MSMALSGSIDEKSSALLVLHETSRIMRRTDRIAFFISLMIVSPFNYVHKTLHGHIIVLTFVANMLNLAVVRIFNGKH